MDRKREIVGLVAWIFFSFAASAGAVFISIGPWYDTINKPSWNPPNWIFGPVWSSLYLMIGTAAWLVWRRGGWASNSSSLGMFVLQWVLNLLWTPIFFGLHWMGVALLEIVLMWLAIVGTMVLFSKTSKLAAGLLVPYLLWVSFATFLNFTLWRMN